MTKKIENIIDFLAVSILGLLLISSVVGLLETTVPDVALGQVGGTSTAWVTVRSMFTCSPVGTTLYFGEIDSSAVYNTNDNTTTTITANGVMYLKVYDTASTSPGLWSSTTTPPNILGSANDAYADNVTLAAGTEGYGLRAATTTDGSNNALNMSYRYNEIFGTFVTQSTHVGGLEAGLSSAVAMASTTTGATTQRKVVVKYLVAVGGSTPAGDYKSAVNYLCVATP